MIKLSILKSNDSDRVGSYHFEKNLIYIGHNHDADIYVPDDHLIKNHLFIELVDDKALAQLNKQIDYILINGKRTNKFKHIKVGDQIEINSLVFTIDHFEKRQKTSKREFLNESSQNLKQTNADLFKLIDELSEKL